MHQRQIEPQAEIEPQILDAAKEVFAARRSLTLAAQRERVETRAACARSPGDVRRELDRKLLAAAGLEDGELERARSEYRHNSVSASAAALASKRQCGYASVRGLLSQNVLVDVGPELALA
jgi:hypothetical protein